MNANFKCAHEEEVWCNGTVYDCKSVNEESVPAKAECDSCGARAQTLEETTRPERLGEGRESEPFLLAR